MSRHSGMHPATVVAGSLDLEQLEPRRMLADSPADPADVAATAAAAANAAANVAVAVPVQQSPSLIIDLRGAGVLDPAIMDFLRRAAEQGLQDGWTLIDLSGGRISAVSVTWNWNASRTNPTSFLIRQTEGSGIRTTTGTFQTLSNETQPAPASNLAPVRQSPDPSAASAAAAAREAQNLIKPARRAAHAWNELIEIAMFDAIPASQRPDRAAPESGNTAAPATSADAPLTGSKLNESRLRDAFADAASDEELALRMLDERMLEDAIDEDQPKQHELPRVAAHAIALAPAVTAAPRARSSSTVAPAPEVDASGRAAGQRIVTRTPLRAGDVVESTTAPAGERAALLEQDQGRRLATASTIVLAPRRRRRPRIAIDGALDFVRSRSSTLLLMPTLVAAVISLVACVWSVGFRLTRPYPLTPWESAFIMDAARAAKGLPVYEQLGVGHATHMYGPLGTYVLAAVFKFTGPNVFAGRAINVVAALVLTAVFLRAFVTRRQLVYALLGLAMILALHYRCRAYFTETRPDVMGLLLATLSLVFAYRAHLTNRLGWSYAIAAVLAVLAFLSKQTYAAAVLVPPIAVLLTCPRPLRRHLLASLAPGAAMALTLVVMKLYFPLVWFYVVEVATKFEIIPERAELALYSLFTYSPLFVALAFALALHRSFEPRRERKIMWLLTATAIGGAAAVFAFAKRGGSYNSLMLAFAPMTAFCMVAFPRVWDILHEAHVSRLVRWGASITLALLFAATTFGVPASQRVAFQFANNTENYDRAIRIAKRLRGRVLVPDEPTVMLFARGKFERSLDAELDAHGRPPKFPPSVASYLKSADYIIRVHSHFDNLGFGSNDLMHHLGFEQVQRSGLKKGYSLWKRASTPHPATTQPQPQPRRIMRQDRVY